MTTPHAAPHDTPSTFNELRRGATYRATTDRGATVGEYLGLESPHGDRAMLLRHPDGTDAIPLADVTSIQALAA